MQVLDYSHLCHCWNQTTSIKFLSTASLGGQGDLVSRLIREITKVTIWVIGVINLVTKSP